MDPLAEWPAIDRKVPRKPERALSPGAAGPRSEPCEDYGIWPPGAGEHGHRRGQVRPDLPLAAKAVEAG